MFGAGVLLALSPDSPPGIESLLFGDILGPSDADLLAAAALAVLVSAAAWLLHGRLLATGFDRASARALGISPAAVEATLLILLSAATVVAVQGLGNLLVVAVFVGPAAAARRLTDRIAPMIAIATAIGVLAGLAGLYLSYYAGTAAGASVALAIVAAYLLAAALGPLAPRPRGRPGGATIDCDARRTADSAWAEHALATLQSAGLRRGGARTAVVEALARHDCAVTALELDDELRRGAATLRRGPASTGRSSSSSSSAWWRGSRSRAAPPAMSGSSRAGTTTTTRSAAIAGAWCPSRTPASSGRSAASPSRSASRSPTTTSSCAGSARAAPPSRPAARGGRAALPRGRRLAPRRAARGAR